MNGEYLGGVEGFTEHVHGAELPTEDPVGISSFRRSKKALVIALFLKSHKK